MLAADLLKQKSTMLSKGSSEGTLAGASDSVGGSANAKTAAANNILDLILSGDLSDEESAGLREKADARIMAKLESGKKLTPKEMQYLKRYNPALYAKALRVQLTIQQIEEQLKHAKSKEEVANIKTFAVGSISKNDPDRKYLIAAINQTLKDFQSSDAYKRLPETEEKRRRAQNDWKPKDAEEEENDDRVSLESFRYSEDDCGYQLGFSGSDIPGGFQTAS